MSNNRKILIVAVIFCALSGFMLFSKGSLAEITKLSNKPITYSRVSSATKAKEITGALKKDADKYHKQIVKCKTSRCVKYVKSKKYAIALLTYMFGKYLSYIRQFDLEYDIDFYPNPEDEDMFKESSFIKYDKSKKKWAIKMSVKQYKKYRKHNAYIRQNVLGALKNELKFPIACSEQDAIDIITNWICDLVEYDYSEKGRHNIWYAFRDKLVLCMGYADTFQVIASEVGIKCWSVSSYDHEFNKVTYNGEIRYVDVCWMDAWNKDPNMWQIMYSQLHDLTHHDIISTEEYKIIKISKRNFKEI